MQLEVVHKQNFGFPSDDMTDCMQIFDGAVNHVNNDFSQNGLYAFIGLIFVYK